MQLALGPLLAACLLALSPVAHGQVLPQAAPEPTAAPAPATAAEPDPALASPHATMTTFIDAMNRAAEAAKRDDKAARAEALADADRTLDLSAVNAERAGQLSVRLIGILNRLGIYQPWYLWHQGEGGNATEQVYFPHPRFGPVVAGTELPERESRIALRRGDDANWRFSAETVAGIDAFYLAIERLPIRVGVDERDLSSELWLRARMPEELKGKRILTLEYWQWLSLAVFIFLGVVLDHLFRLVVRAIAARLVRRQGGEPDPEQMRRTVRPAGLLVMALFWTWLVWLLGLPDLAYTIVQGAARVFAVLAGTWFAWRFVDLVSEALTRKAERTATKFDDVLVPLMRTTARIFIVVFALIYGGLSLNFDITPLLASLTIGGVGFAFAAKDTLENFFGSATVLIDQPFGVGDWVLIGDVEGTVEQIGFRSTRIRTFRDSLVTIPNANLVRASVENYGRRRYRRWSTNIGVQYDTTPDQLLAFTEGVRELIRRHPYTRKDFYMVHVTAFGASSIDVMVYMFFDCPDWGTEVRERERLMLDIMRLARRIGVQFAFPTRTVHLVQGDGEPPAAADGSVSDADASALGAQAASEVTAHQPWRHTRPGPATI